MSVYDQANADFLDGDIIAVCDMKDAIDNCEISISDLPKEVLARKHSTAFLLGACHEYRQMAVLYGRLLKDYREFSEELEKKIKCFQDNPATEDLIQELETIQSKYQQSTQYLDKLQQEKSARYKMRRQQHDDRKKIYQKCKEQGMTDADTYREIISIEEPNLKPGTASYISAMNRLRMWKSRHKEEM